MTARELRRSAQRLSFPTAADEMVTHKDLAEWHGKNLVDRDGEWIGKLE